MNKIRMSPKAILLSSLIFCGIAQAGIPLQSYCPSLDKIQPSDGGWVVNSPGWELVQNVKYQKGQLPSFDGGFWAADPKYYLSKQVLCSYKIGYSDFIIGYTRKTPQPQGPEWQPETNPSDGNVMCNGSNGSINTCPFPLY